jgi:putative Mn2+ efflux pump MntP
MRLPELLLIAVSLAMDAFAVSLAAGARRPSVGHRGALRLAFHFGLFQFMMPVIGWFIGTRVAMLIADYDHWVAFGLLAFVGLRMIRAGWRAGPEGAPREDPSRGWTLAALSLATSIDALAIGLSLALLRTGVWYPSAVIGVVTATLSLLGVRLGHRLGGWLGRPMEIAGGVVLNLLGLRILISHLST